MAAGPTHRFIRRRFGERRISALCGEPVVERARAIFRDRCIAANAGSE